MLTWVIYDISSDKARKKIASICLQMGLYRVQKSVFLGVLVHSQRDALIKHVEMLFDPDTDRVYFSPLCEQDAQRIWTLGEGFHRELVADKVDHFMF